jgi:hypothetical protein
MKPSGWEKESKRHRKAYYKGKATHVLGNRITNFENPSDLSQDRTWDFPSRSRPGMSYTVQFNDRGELTCDCPSWVYNSRHRTPRTCKHTDEVERMRGQTPTQRTTPRPAPTPQTRRRLEAPVRVSCSHCNSRYDEDEVIIQDIHSNEREQDVVTFECPNCRQTTRSLRTR